MEAPSLEMLLSHPDREFCPEGPCLCICSASDVTVSDSPPDSHQPPPIPRATPPGGAPTALHTHMLLEENPVWQRALHPHPAHVLLHNTSSYSEHLTAPLHPSIPTATSIRLICIQSHSLETSQLFYSNSFASVPILTLELCSD